MKQSSSSLVVLESVDDVVDVRKKNKFVKWPLKGKKPKKGSDEDGSNSMIASYLFFLTDQLKVLMTTRKISSKSMNPLCEIQKTKSLL
jgi:hypothetical protein